MAGPSSASNWQRVSAGNPCPICQHPDWCSITPDGTLAKCMRVADGAFKTGAQTDGARYYLHRLDGTIRPEAPPPHSSGPATPRADVDLLHRAYSALLARLRLAQTHREGLQARCLADNAIDRNGYQTLPIHGRARVAGELRDKMGDGLLSVPGFVVKPGKSGPYLTIAGAAGLLVPIRDAAGRIVALSSRRDDPGDGRGKYLYLSSAKAGGPGPGAPVHVPLGTAAPCEVCRLTEGALKADVASALSGVPTIGAAGLAWRPALDVLRELSCRTLRLAFDADALNNAHVARALADCAEAAAGAGLAVEVERWDKADGKGIDDLLAGGKAPELLTGEAARAAIREILAAATAGEAPAAPDPLDRLPELLGAGDAAALFADREILEALACLADADPAAFAGHRARLKGLVGLRDLDAALQPLRRQQAHDRPPVLLAEAGYRIAGGRLCRERGTQDGGTNLVPLCNFTARIEEVTTRDDGAEQAAFFTVAGTLASGRALPAVHVPAADFAGLTWVTSAWHGEAVVYAGQAMKDHLRAAIELLSADRGRRTIYAHTGWRKIGDGWFYLHAGGAIGADGPAAGVEVSLPDALAGFALPAPPAWEDLAAAVRASVRLLDGLAPDRIAFPLLAAVYRAALGDAPGPSDFALWLAGPHGTAKSELAALCQQHYGAGLVRLKLPGNWSSTANALEGLAFAAKDALLVVDDYAPRGAAGDRQRLERDADRLLRAQGNRAGRQRMRADQSLRADRPPRGLTLSTGEDVPPGQSLRGRLLVLEVSPGEVPLAGLTPRQRAAAAGQYAQALAGYVGWLAPQYDALAAWPPAPSRPRTGTPWPAAAGRRCRKPAPRRRNTFRPVEPTELFLRFLAAALASGRAHAAGPAGTEPEAPQAPQAWGWRLRTGEGWQPYGDRIGWIDGADLYLQPEASYAAAQELARDQGDALPVSPRTLWRRLKERGLLASRDDTRQRNTLRRTLEGVNREVLHLWADTLTPGGPSKPSKPSNGDRGPPENVGKMDGPVGRSEAVLDGPGMQPSNATVQNNGRIPAESPSVGRFGRSETGRDGPPGEDHTRPPGKGDAWEGD